MNNINKEDLEILMLDNCTKFDAIKHLKNGTMIFEDFEENFYIYMKEWNIEEEELLLYRKMIDEKIPVRDWSIVENNGKTYYIAYVL